MRRCERNAVPAPLRFPDAAAAHRRYVIQTLKRDKVYRVIEERNLASFANNSRWNGLFSRLLSHRIPARLKHVARPQMSDWSVWVVPASNTLEVVSNGPVHFREIEWVDFDCKGDVDTAACTAAVREAKLTSEVVGQTVRVFGYR